MAKDSAARADGTMAEMNAAEMMTSFFMDWFLFWVGLVRNQDTTRRVSAAASGLIPHCFFFAKKF